MGLQTYNSVRVLDLVQPVAGRGCRTDRRNGGQRRRHANVHSLRDRSPAGVAFPAVMVSTAMQGGCSCENACYLRIGTGNVELAALIAPRRWA